MSQDEWPWRVMFIVILITSLFPYYPSCILIAVSELKIPPSLPSFLTASLPYINRSTGFKIPPVRHPSRTLNSHLNTNFLLSSRTYVAVL